MVSRIEVLVTETAVMEIKLKYRDGSHSAIYEAGAHLCMPEPLPPTPLSENTGMGSGPFDYRTYVTGFYTEQNKLELLTGLDSVLAAYEDELDQLLVDLHTKYCTGITANDFPTAESRRIASMLPQFSTVSVFTPEEEKNVPDQLASIR